MTTKRNILEYSLLKNFWVWISSDLSRRNMYEKQFIRLEIGKVQIHGTVVTLVGWGLLIPVYQNEEIIMKPTDHCYG